MFFNISTIFGNKQNIGNEEFIKQINQDEKTINDSI